MCASLRTLFVAFAMVSLSYCENPGQLCRAQPFFISGYGEGIYYSSLSADGAMAEPKLLAKQHNASFFCFHPTKKDLLYAVAETMRSDANHPASVVAYRFNREAAIAGKDPELTAVAQFPIDGDIPCHITMDPAGGFLVVANYTNGSVVVLSVNQQGEITGQAANIQHSLVDGKKTSNGHCSLVSPSGKWVLVADLGLDRVFVYKVIEPSGKLAPASHPFLRLADGAGPRHVALHPNGKYLYVINESNLTMTSAAWDESLGKLTEINTVSTVPEGTTTTGFSTAEVLVHPSGRFVFGSNRGHDSIVTMAIDQADGSIKRIANTPTLGKTPRNFRLTPDGLMLLAENQTSNSVFSFAVDPSSGKLSPTGHSIEVKSPACIKFINELK